jgi:hypothetical protein
MCSCRQVRVVGQTGLELATALIRYPVAPRTHWQYVWLSHIVLITLMFNRQARLLLPEPLAVNRGERVVGTMHFKVCQIYDNRKIHADNFISPRRSTKPDRTTLFSTFRLIDPDQNTAQIH